MLLITVPPLGMTPPLQPEQELAAAVVRLTLEDLAWPRRPGDAVPAGGLPSTLSRTAARQIRAGGLERWLLPLEAYPLVATRARDAVEEAVAATLTSGGNERT